MRQRWVGFLGLGDEWRRPLPHRWLRHDILIAGTALLLAVIGLETSRGIGLLATVDHPVWAQYLALVLTAVILIWRRRFPLTAMLLVSAAMFVTGVTMPEVMQLFIPQCLYLYGFYCGIAWGGARTRTMLVTAATVLFMFGWVGWQYVGGDGFEMTKDMKQNGLFPADTASVLYTLLINIVYFGGATVAGQLAWRDARNQSELAAQSHTIEAQTVELQQQAVVEERLRIARELHDVVAHHVAVMGVQAGAARKSLAKRPEASERSLRQIEASAREAVGEMRNLLGTLRHDAEADRMPRPSSADIADLVERTRESGFDVTYVEVEEQSGMIANVPEAVGLSLYRTVQEALSNVRRHSTADSARVVLRVGTQGEQDFGEVEILDDGPARAGTSGTGLGLIGMRERVATHGGSSEIGPRRTGGYRVRVRLPLATAPKQRVSL